MIVTDFRFSGYMKETPFLGNTGNAEAAKVTNVIPSGNKCMNYCKSNSFKIYAPKSIQ